MRNSFLSLIFASWLVLLLGLCTGCASGEFVKASLGQEFLLRIGQTAQIENEQLSIQFKSVAGDSRCPRGVQCFWAGEVKCEVLITDKGSSSNITLTQSGAEQSSEITYKEYRLIYSVEPYPEAPKQISNAEYRLKLTVEKLPQSIDQWGGIIFLSLRAKRGNLSISSHLRDRHGATPLAMTIRKKPLPFVKGD